MQQIQALVKAVITLFIAGIIVYVIIASCVDSNTPQPVRRGSHSNIADIYLPEGAKLDPASTSQLEMWNAGYSIDYTTRQMTSLLPINQPLDGLPYCGSTTGCSSARSTYWAWGTSTDKVEVGAIDFSMVRDGFVMISISRGAPKNGVCQPGD
jgi:hypothetical protein